MSPDPRRDDALGRPIDALPWFVRVSRPLRITFPAANTQRDVAHTLSVTPVGMLVIWQDAPVIATPGKLWTPSLAYLQASTANAHAIVIFFTTREDPVNA